VGKPRAWLVALGVLLLGRRRRPTVPPDERERIVPEAPPSPRVETTALVLLFLGALFAVGFVVVYVLDRLPRQTQLLGATLGLSLACIATALLVTAHRLVVTEELESEYPLEEHLAEQAKVVEIVEESGDRLTRRRLFKLGLGAAGGALGLAALTPLVSLGPALDMDPLVETPWRRGRRLVDEAGKPLRADAIEEKSFYTAFPEGADTEELGAPVVLVRLPRRELRLPPEQSDFDADGILAYSKICTHAGCAIAMYRVPKFAPTEPKPALVCPCHYSTFDVATGGDVIFGPAGRKLPMLPLAIDGDGNLRAAGNFDEPVGPSWWGVRSRSAKS
jgi:quinol---cytochrome c reductase iron-sulfur subunit